MGLFKKLTVRNKQKSTWNLTEEVPKLDPPKLATRPVSITHAPPPPPYELENDIGDEDADTGSILIGIDFGTT
jgi:hypothetical protein